MEGMMVAIRFNPYIPLFLHAGILYHKSFYSTYDHDNKYQWHYHFIFGTSNNIHSFHFSPFGKYTSA